MSSNDTFELKFTQEAVDRCNQWRIHLTKDVFDKFVSKITEPTKMVFERDTCRIWTGTKQSKQGTKGGNHGLFVLNQKLHGAHRFMYTMAHGIPPDLPNVRPRDPCPCGALNVKTKQPKRYDHCCRPVIRHICKDINGNDFDGSCVNPLHMTLGTFEENQHDIRRHGTAKGGVAKGDKTGWATMTNEIAQQVWEEIQQRGTEQKEGKREHLGIKELCVKYNISKHTIVAMRQGKGWNEITGKSKEEYNQRRIDRDEQKYQVKMLKRKNPTAVVVIPVKRVKLNLESAQQLVLDFAGGTSKPELQQKYGIASTTVRDVLLGITFPTLDRSSIQMMPKTQTNEKPEGTKTCTGPCGMVKPLSEFGWMSKTKNKLQSRCLKCRSDSRKSKKQTSKPVNM
jgi:hypothetical protein